MSVSTYYDPPKVALSSVWHSMTPEHQLWLVWWRWLLLRGAVPYRTNSSGAETTVPIPKSSSFTDVCQKEL